MKLKALLVALVLFAVVVPTGIVFAQEVVASPTQPISTVEPVADETQGMIDELAQLKLKVKDPATGSFTRFILRFQIRQLENQLNVKKALQENPA